MGTEAGRDTDVYLAAVVTRRRDPRVELLTRMWCAERLHGLVRIGSSVGTGQVGEVAMVARIPPEAYEAIPRWRWAVATLVAPATATFSDDELLRRIARQVHTAPGLNVRCLSAEEFDAVWVGNSVVPAARGLRFARNPEAA